VAAGDPDLAADTGLRQAAVLALEHPALDLAAHHRGLDQHLRVDGAGGGNRGVEVGPVGDAGDADARPGPRRLDEHRQAEAVPVGRRQRLAGAQHRVRAHRDALGDR
jgi:hypothetical protein